MHTRAHRAGAGVAIARTERASTTFRSQPHTSCTASPSLPSRVPPRLANRQCRTAAAGNDPDLSPAHLMRQLASQYGVKVAGASARGMADIRSGPPGGDELDEDEDELEDESWEDVVDDLGNPWDMRPAKVGLMEDDDDGPSAGPVGATTTATGAEAASSAAPTVSPYLDPTALPRLGRGELLDLAGVRQGEEPGTPNAAEAAPEATGRGRLVVVDVGEEGRHDGRSTAPGGGDSGGGFGAASQTLPVDGVPLPYVHIPLAALRRPQAEALEEQWDYVAVRVQPGDLRAEQAVVRLTKVYGMRRVMLYDESME